MAIAATGQRAAEMCSAMAVGRNVGRRDLDGDDRRWSRCHHRRAVRPSFDYCGYGRARGGRETKRRRRQGIGEGVSGDGDRVFVAGRQAGWRGSVILSRSGYGCLIDDSWHRAIVTPRRDKRFHMSVTRRRRWCASLLDASRRRLEDDGNDDDGDGDIGVALSQHGGSHSHEGRFVCPERVVASRRIIQPVADSMISSTCRQRSQSDSKTLDSDSDDTWLDRTASSSIDSAAEASTTSVVHNSSSYTSSPTSPSLPSWRAPSSTTAADRTATDSDTLYTIRLVTSRDRGSGLSQPEAGVALSIIGQEGRSIVQWLPALKWGKEQDDDDGHVKSLFGEEGEVEKLAERKSQRQSQSQSQRNEASATANDTWQDRPREMFQKGAIDFVHVAGVDVGSIRALWIAPCAGTWRIESVTVKTIRPIQFTEDSTKDSTEDSAAEVSDGLATVSPLPVITVAEDASSGVSRDRGRANNFNDGMIYKDAAKKAHNSARDGKRDGHALDINHETSSLDAIALDEEEVALRELLSRHHDDDGVVHPEQGGLQYVFQSEGVLIGDGKDMTAAMELRPTSVTRWSESDSEGERNVWEEWFEDGKSMEKTEMARANGMAEYEGLKQWLLQSMGLLVLSGSVMTGVAYGIALGEAFAMGGFVGLIYLLLLQQFVDSLLGHEGQNEVILIPDDESMSTSLKKKKGEDEEGKSDHGGHVNQISEETFGVVLSSLKEENSVMKRGEKLISQPTGSSRFRLLPELDHIRTLRERQGWGLVDWLYRAAKQPGVRLSIVVSMFIFLLKIVPERESGISESGVSDAFEFPQFIAAGCGFFMYKVSVLLAAMVQSSDDQS